MKKRIHIKIADTGWILEKCAREISERNSEVSFGTEPNPLADLQYYINYSARSRRVSPIEVGFFTHSEKDEGARRRYFDAAFAVDHCVCMSAKYAKELIENGVPEDKVTVIAPGVDLDVMQPKVRIGVVGRTYHTGRKGEALVARVMDIPGIEWRFTGSGWPGASTHVPEAGMAEFYNDLDYVLVPALYEGGPMAVLEGLACGIPIIASDVGWAQEFPHISFEVGNAESLRSVLTGLVSERHVLREAVLHRSWAAWADEHSKLFSRMLGGTSSASAPQRESRRPRKRVTLITHGTEGTSIGGPSVRVPRTATELAKLGIGASLPRELGNNYDSSQLAHIFNIWPAESCFKTMDRARAVGKRTVLSPIFLNLSNIQFASRTMPRLFADNRSSRSIDMTLSEIAREIAGEPNLPIREPFEGYHDRVRVCVESADEVIYLSDYERRCLEHIGATPSSSTLVCNPVDASGFANADPRLFSKTFGIEDYILCVGRIEPRKNQLVLAHAAKTLGKTVVFIGHTESQPYLDLVRNVAGDAGRFIPRIDPADPLLKSAFAGASAFCLPSWAEGAPLAALEAAAAGLPMVLSDRSSEKEYFGAFAEYVNPADINGMRDALERAVSQRGDAPRQRDLQSYVTDNFSWEKYATETAAAYDKLGLSRKSVPVAKRKNQKIYFDLTTTFHASGHPTGIARVEGLVIRALVEQFGDRIVPVVWSSRTKGYLQVSRATALVGADLAELERMEKLGEAQSVFDGGMADGRIIVVGGAWIRNSEYVGALRALKQESGSNLTVLVHDLIQMKLAHFYPDGVGAEFEANARLIADAADDFLVYSDCTSKDLQDFLIDNGQSFKKISKFRLGDMTSLYQDKSVVEDHVESELQKRFAGKKFVIYVSTIEIRKNHALLINVWRRLIEERGSAAPHLVLIGRSLWRGDEFTSALKREPGLQAFVHVLDNVDDRDLDWFYRNCFLTVYPSLYEGWGLPVAESMSYGKMCITSANTATREIAPTLTDLLDPYDFRAWRDRISFYLDNPSALQSVEQKIQQRYVAYPWDDVAHDLVSIVDDLPISTTLSTFVFPRQEIKFVAEEKSSSGMQVCGIGWGQAEVGGRWSIGRTSKLVFRYPAKSDQFYLRLRMRTFTASANTGRLVWVTINDDAKTLHEFTSPLASFDLAIPVQRKKGSKFEDTVIVFEPVELLSPQMANGSPDERFLGLQLVSAQFADEPFSEAAPQTLLSPATAGTSASFSTQTLVDDLAAVNDLALAKELVALPSRFTGKRFFARVARFIGFDKLWLRWHARKFRRTYSSINLIIDYLSAEKRR